MPSEPLPPPAPAPAPAGPAAGLAAAPPPSAKQEDRPAAGGRTSWWDRLASQGLGLLLGQASAVLLGLGTVVIAATRDDASAGVQADELDGFLSPPQWTHLWLYVLFAVTALWAINTILCTWQAVVARLRAKVMEPVAWAPTVIHVAFLLALVSHLVGGLSNHELESVTLTRSWSRLDDGRRIRLVRVDRQLTPGRKVKALDATVEVQDPAGKVETVVIGYNQPLSSGLGANLLLIAQAGQLRVARFSQGESRCSTPVPGECWLGDTRIEVRDVRESAAWGQVAVVAVEAPGAPGAPGARGEVFPLAAGARHPLASGMELQFEGVAVEDAVALRRRSAPGHPWALFSAVLLVVGLGMMGRRWVR
jgi:hypothetical protein